MLLNTPTVRPSGANCTAVETPGVRKSANGACVYGLGGASGGDAKARRYEPGTSDTNTASVLPSGEMSALHALSRCVVAGPPATATERSRRFGRVPTR